jgi:hypothetical protein
VGVIYDPRGLSGVTTVRPRVTHGGGSGTGPVADDNVRPCVGAASRAAQAWATAACGGGRTDEGARPWAAVACGGGSTIVDGSGTRRVTPDRGQQRRMEECARRWAATACGGESLTVDDSEARRRAPGRGQRQRVEEGARRWVAVAGTFDRDLKSRVWRESGVEHGLCKLYKHRQK